MNTNSDLDPQNEMHSFAHVSPEEFAPDLFTEIDPEPYEGTDPEPYEGAGFPGCGDGSDDLADANANEADDYRDEGCEVEGDGNLDADWENQNDLSCNEY
jgi:hypothetical protein